MVTLIAPFALPMIEASTQQSGTMTVGTMLIEVGDAIPTVMPNFEVILLTAIVLGAVIFIIATLYRRLRR